jgi:hypothetical protein
MSLLRKVVIVVCTSWSGSAFALTGNELFENCNAKERVTDALCYGYVLGAMDAVFAGVIRAAVCMPANATQRQVVDTVTKYLGDHPETRHYNAASDVAVALVKAFPCEGGPPK